MEFWDPDRQKGVVYAFRGTVEEEKAHSFVLRGLEPLARYRLRFHDHTAPDRIATGQELMDAGLQATLPFPNSSELIFIEKAAGDSK